MTIKQIIRDGLAKKSKELKEKLLDITAIKEKLEQNKIDFNIKLDYLKELDLMDVEYIFKTDMQQITINFRMDELIFDWEFISNSTILLDYAISYFNNKKDFKIDMGECVYFNLTEYFNYLDENVNSNLTIYDDIKKEIIVI